MATTDKTRTRRRSGDGRRRELVAQAAALFEERGYHNTSVEDLAEACGIRKATLYHYFKSKDEILFWIHETFINMLLERQEAREAESLPPQEALRAIMADVLDLMRTHPGYVRVFFEHHRELGEPERGAIKEKRDAYQRAIERIFEEGVRSGEFRDIDPRLVTLVLAGMCNWAYHWYRPDGPLTSDQIADAFCEILIHGFRSDAP